MMSYLFAGTKQRIVANITKRLASKIGETRPNFNVEGWLSRMVNKDALCYLCAYMVMIFKRA
jgi:hypothetical protein